MHTTHARACTFLLSAEQKGSRNWQLVRVLSGDMPSFYVAGFLLARDAHHLSARTIVRLCHCNAGKHIYIYTRRPGFYHRYVRGMHSVFVIEKEMNRKAKCDMNGYKMTASRRTALAASQVMLIDARRVRVCFSMTNMMSVWLLASTASCSVWLWIATQPQATHTQDQKVLVQLQCNLETSRTENSPYVRHINSQNIHIRHWIRWLLEQVFYHSSQHNSFS